ncbi:MAG: helix-turn-helix transcriptional regulator [Solirubrobacterales bacterium]|nr:helix-turn-helix transcriptional regulator [Solirubrobacterales bacterium]
MSASTQSSQQVPGAGHQSGADPDADAADNPDVTAEGCREPKACCPLYHEAVELVGRRWTGAILAVLMDGPLRFSEIAHAVPELSDRLLSERMKELEKRGIVSREVQSGPPVRVEYGLSEMGHELGPALVEIQRWARRWLRD